MTFEFLNLGIIPSDTQVLLLAVYSMIIPSGTQRNIWYWESNQRRPNKKP